MSLERVVTPGQRDASAALGRSVAAVREVVEGSRPESAQVSAQLRELGRRNHFAESIYELFQGGH